MWQICLLCCNMLYCTAGFSGSAASSEGLCVYCIDDTKPDGSHPALMGFILADRVREAITWSQQERFYLNIGFSSLYIFTLITKTS